MNSPTPILADTAAGECEIQACLDVGAVRQDAISIRELSAHAAECHLLMQLARARCRPELHSEQDERDAAMWAQAKDDALKALLAARRDLQKDQELTFGGVWTQELPARAV